MNKGEFKIQEMIFIMYNPMFSAHLHLVLAKLILELKTLIQIFR